MITRFCIWFLRKNGWLVEPMFDGEEAIVLFMTDKKTVFYDSGGAKWTAWRR